VNSKKVPIESAFLLGCGIYLRSLLKVSVDGFLIGNEKRHVTNIFMIWNMTVNCTAMVCKYYFSFREKKKKRACGVPK